MDTLLRNIPLFRRLPERYLYAFLIASTLILTAILLMLLGRTWLGPDGTLGLWSGDVKSSHNSQWLSDPYTFSHFLHGIIFLFLIWLVARRLPVHYSFLISLIIEAGWELLENSPAIINRYRETAMAQGYFGDSIINSLCDILAMAIGFWFARKVPVWVSILVIIAIEVISLILIRDNLTLNILMLLYPIASVQQWQSAL